MGARRTSSNYVFVRIDTDEGISGVGEATLESKELSVLGAIEECKRLLIGKDPRDIELNWVTMNRYAPWKGAALFSAMSGLEHAMWDIAGKAAGLPVYRMLGGPVRESIPAYTWPGPYHHPEELGEAALYAHETYGYNNFKIDPFTSYFTVTAEEIRLLERCMAAIRDALRASRRHRGRWTLAVQSAGRGAHRQGDGAVRSTLPRGTLSLRQRRSSGDRAEDDHDSTGDRGAGLHPLGILEHAEA